MDNNTIMIIIVVFLAFMMLNNNSCRENFATKPTSIKLCNMAKQNKFTDKHKNCKGCLKIYCSKNEMDEDNNGPLTNCLDGQVCKFSSDNKNLIDFKK